MKRNPDSPWNPAEPLEITPVEYEREVLHWLSIGEPSLADYRIAHREIVKGAAGDYQIDVVVEFTAFRGSAFRVLVECKRHGRPVERDDVMAFAMKVQDTGSHKGILFATAGFQSGALQVARTQGLATITFLDGQATYETKADGAAGEPPPGVHRRQFAGWFLSPTPTGLAGALVERDCLDPIVDWLAGTSEDET